MKQDREHQFIALGNMEPKYMGNRIVFQPLPARLIEEYAHKVCEEMSEQQDASCNTMDVIWGFAEFVKIVSTIKVRELNEGLEMP